MKHGSKNIGRRQRRRKISTKEMLP